MITTKLRYACMLKPGIRVQYKVQRRMHGKRITLDTAAIPALLDVNEMMRMYDRTGIVLQMGTKTAKIFDRVLEREHRQSLLTGHSRQALRSRKYLTSKDKRTYRRNIRKMQTLVGKIKEIEDANVWDSPAPGQALTNHRMVQPTDADSKVLQEYVADALQEASSVLDNQQAATEAQRPV